MKYAPCFLLMICGFAVAMDEKQITVPNSAKQFIREFPLMTSKLARWKYENSDDEVRKQIIKKINKKQNSFFSLLLVLETQLPGEIQQKILSSFFNNEPLSDAFKKLSIQYHGCLDSFKWANDVQHYKAAGSFNHRLKNISCGDIPIDFLMKNSHEIKRIDTLGKYASKDDLKVISIVNEKLKTFDAWLHYGDLEYRYYDVYTIRNCLDKLRKSEHADLVERIFIIYTIFYFSVITTWISRDIELTECKKMLTENDIAWNKQVPIFNAWVQGQYAKLKYQNPGFYEHIINQINLAGNFVFPLKAKDVIAFGARDLIEEYYSWPDYLKINSPFFVLPGILAFVAAAIEELRRHRQDFLLRILGEGSVIGLFGGAILGSFFKVLSFLRFDSFPFGFGRVFGCGTGVFMGGIIGVILKETHTLKKARVENIVELLKRTDIVIE